MFLADFIAQQVRRKPPSQQRNQPASRPSLQKDPPFRHAWNVSTKHHISRTAKALMIRPDLKEEKASKQYFQPCHSHGPLLHSPFFWFAAHFPCFPENYLWAARSNEGRENS
jgi:hypothetical protein